MKKYIALVVLIVIVGGAGYLCIRFYPYVFARTVRGEILKVERINENQAIITNGGNIPANQLYSYAVSIRDSANEIHTASSEDRQWAVAQSGQCVEAKFFPYPPWNLDKANTYYGARLERLFDCQKK
jgi:hypothetical protein